MVPLASLSLTTGRARLGLEAEAPVHPQGTGEGLSGLGDTLRAILAEDRLKPHFQPIVDLETGVVLAFEGLIRGPSDTLLHSPASLFKVAALTNQLYELECACCATLVRAYAASGATQKLFLNMSPGSLATAARSSLQPIQGLEELGVPPGRIVIELTEALPITDLGVLAKAIALFRKLGFAVALDDLGEGFSSLRLWSELRPEFVKVDMHFIQGVSRDPVKLQFLKSLCDIAAKTGAKVVGEGLELEADLAVVRDLGLDYGQGYLLGRPAPLPHAATAPGLFRRREPDGSGWIRDTRSTAARLMVEVPALSPDTPNGTVEKLFQADADLQSIPVVRDGIPVGLINRHVFMDMMFKPFSREVYGKKPVEAIMDRNILVLDHHTSLHELSRLIVESDPRHILHGYILTREGAYAGMGSGHDLMREITQMQIKAARYANPLTGLPGNVPINEHLDDLLHQNLPFVACYCDLDHFKPYNDVHGYRRGDDVIQWTGDLLRSACDPDLDFVGHIGGDDFMLVFRSPDWERRCNALLEAFDAGLDRFFSPEVLDLRGYAGEDRSRRQVLHPLLSLSMGAVKAHPGHYANHHEISASAAVAKKEAKGREGSILFVERRQPRRVGR
ncbi:GGDEF domain-containing protein [Mesoterricola silvestris]|uniref:GGDEF domain-containing protein n=1 Tax=Mesoterricola silvestris TaxID=2927979 RepID=A0AA48K932_9BACT|nr:GGDEF domain-containing protein [Mesoterricola silvestris]BDU72996.1 GGDEF domain-containing protein [Mesoterricola silvestris]